jgi:hypothetical protein
MKIVIKENQLSKLIKSYLDSQNWKVWDEGDGEFNVSDGGFGKDIFKYRIQYSSTIPDHNFNVIYISEDLITKINNLFSMVNLDSIKAIIDWFNKKYDKNLTMDDFEWLPNSETYEVVDDDMNESLTKKKLVEGMQISDDAPDWVKEFYTLPREGRIEHIEKYKKHIQKLLPRIVEFFKTKFGDDLVHLFVKTKRSHYGNEIYSTDKIVLDFRFSDSASNVNQLKREVFNDLNSFFNIDVSYYGTPLDLDFYKTEWQKF